MAQSFPVQFGEYRLLRKIAQGGMAELFLAQNANGQICALKRILPHLAHEEGFIRMFIDEARIVQHLDHPNVAGVYDQGKVEGYYFIALEYVEGHSMLALNDRAKAMKIPLPFGLLAYVVGELLGGLGSAHNARDRKGRHLGVVHRDVTPQNVMISYEGDVKLIDFGVAKARARLTQTEAGFTKGKLAYMSPEQARGEELDGRSDLFSVGIVLWELTTGQRLFNKEGPGGILGAIVNEPIPPPSTKKRKYPRDLEEIVMKALDKEVAHRWQSAEEMRAALMRFAMRERPKPGRSRLAALVQDLFGDSKHRDLIEQAQALHEPTPAGAVEAQVVRGASVRVGQTSIPDFDTSLDEDQASVRPDETRMMDIAQSAQISLPGRPKPEVTDAGVPALPSVDHKDDLHDPEDIPVPEPKVPWRVRLGRALAALADDLGVSWRAYRGRYLLLLALFAGLGIFGAAHLTGATTSLADFVLSTRDKARELKRSAGLSSQARDASVPTTLLVLGTEPPGALVEIDGIGTGLVTPCEVTDVPIGRRFELGLRLAGHRLHTQEIVLRKGEGRRELTITLFRQLGALSISSEPDGASVYRDGKKLAGVTPMTIESLPTDRPVRIKVAKSGFLSKSKALLTKDGETQSEHFVLEIDKSTIPPGQIVVRSTPSGCPVEVNGDAAGLTPLSDFSAKAGTYTVTVRCEYHRPETRAVVVEPGQKSEISVFSEPNQFGFLSLSFTPAGGNIVKINGRAVVQPIEFLKVVPGRHVVEVVNERLDRKRRFAIEIGPNQRVSRKVNLLR